MGTRAKIAATAKLAKKGNTLVYENRKQDPIRWDISTPELRAKGFLELFEFLKRTWKVYTCGFWGTSDREKIVQKDLYQQACAGDAKAAEKLLTMRIDYEYENWYILDAPAAAKGEPKKVLARRSNPVYVKDIRRQDSSGRYSFELSNGEEIEMMYVPVNTTRQNWENGWLIHHFLIDSFYEKLGRDKDNEKLVEELLSHMNYMRMTLYYTLHPEQMPLGKSLPIWQNRSISAAEGLIERHGGNPVEKLKDKKVRPTDLQKAQNAVSGLILQLESLIGCVKRIKQGKYDLDTFHDHDLSRYEEKIEEIKKGMIED